MSMISGLIDELNKSADEWNASNMFELARMCREAADTIWELRDDLQRTNAENAKLREELADAPKCETCEAMLDCDECLRADGSRKERRRLSAENAKLRELVRDAWGDGHPDRSCDGCDIRDECHDDVERMRKDGVLRFSRCLFELRIEERMRELGVGVVE
jgi:hypothetical protein